MFRLPRHLIINQVIRLKDPVRHGTRFYECSPRVATEEYLKAARVELSS